MFIWTKLPHKKLEEIIIGQGLVPIYKQNGFELRVRDRNHRGRVHVMFSSEGLQIHYDRESDKGHTVDQYSSAAREVFNKLKVEIQKNTKKSIWEKLKSVVASI